MLRHHPIACQVDGLSRTSRPLNRTRLNSLKGFAPPSAATSLRILLVAANLEGTKFPPLCADAEVTRLATEIPKWFRKKGVPVHVETVLSKDANADYLKDLAENQSFDILHFAGHATAYEREGGDPGLYVWEQHGAREPYLFNLPELECLLKRMNVSFAFLNCCRGGAQRDAFYLKHSRLLGIAHSALKAGTAAVLCYRRSVDEECAAEFAMDFYSYLAELGELDLALNEARHSAYKRNHTDPIWLSPMLFSQTS